LWFFGQILGPLPGPVQHPQNPHSVASDAISGDVGRTLNHQLPRSLDAAKAAALRELRQALDLLSDALIHDDSGLWAVRFEVIEDRIAISQRELRPLQSHRLSHLALRGSSPRGKVRFDLFLRYAGLGIVQRFLYFRAKPRIMGSDVIG
jgi:hypothetical protein